jgi:hypothetical protein
LNWHEYVYYYYSDRPGFGAEMITCLAELIRSSVKVVPPLPARRVYTFLLNHPQFAKIESVEKGVRGESHRAPTGHIRGGLSDRQPRRRKGKSERGGRGGRGGRKSEG